MTTLCAVDDDNTPLGGLQQRVQQVLPIGGHVSGAVRLQNDALDRLLQKRLHLQRNQTTGLGHGKVRHNPYTESDRFRDPAHILEHFA